MAVIIYRHGHRIARDKRITTHVALAARAFGADGIVIDTKDEKIEKNIRDVVNRFGGSFFIESGTSWNKYFSSWKGSIVHLTMYGENISTVIKEIQKEKNLLIIVGAEKVPGDFYKIADYNVAIGNQPHSEVSALAVFMHCLTEGNWTEKNFDGIFNIVFCERGKTIKYDYVALLKKVGCNKEVIEHSKRVRDLALLISEMITNNGIHIDYKAVEIGAILHDIGRSKTQDINHIVEGVKIAEKYGLPPKIISIIKHHAGAGIDAHVAKKLGLPEEDYSPQSIEEMIVNHADNLTGYTYRLSTEAYTELRKNAGKKAAEKLLIIHKKLGDMAGKDLDDIVKDINKRKD